MSIRIQLTPEVRFDDIKANLAALGLRDTFPNEVATSTRPKMCLTRDDSAYLWCYADDNGEAYFVCHVKQEKVASVLKVITDHFHVAIGRIDHTEV
jgi:hypothetical protein